jgi:hypothetical protein
MKKERTNPMKTIQRFFTASLLFSFLAFQAHAQDCSTTWLFTTPQNVAISEGPITFAYDQYAYQIGGNQNGGAEYEFAPINSDGSLGQWTTVTNIPDVAQNNPGGIEIGSNLYFIGGWTLIDGIGDKSYSSGCYLAQITNNGLLTSFIQQSSLNTGRSNLGVVYSNGYLYAIGGIDIGSATCSCTNQDINSVEFSQVNTNGGLGPWQFTSSLSTTYGNIRGAWASNGYIYAIGGINYLERAQQNSDGTLSAWEVVEGPLPGGNNIVLTADNQIYIDGAGPNGYEPIIYKGSFDPLTGNIDSLTTDSRQNPDNIYTEGIFTYWPYLYIIGDDSVNNAECIYTCDTMTQKDFAFASSIDTGEWVYQSVSGTSTEPTISWLSTYNGSSTGVLEIQFTQPNQGIKLTLFQAGWFGTISDDWYELKAQVYSNITTYPNEMFGVANFFNGATGPLDISGHGLYSVYDRVVLSERFPTILWWHIHVSPTYL